MQKDLDNNPVLSYRFPFETMEDEKGEAKDYLYISDNSVRYVFEGEEKDDTLILPAKKKVLLM